MKIKMFDFDSISKSNKTILFVAIVISIQYIAAAYITLMIPTDPKNALLGGFSFSRMLLVFICVVFSIVGIVGGIIAFLRKTSTNTILCYILRRRFQYPFFIFLFLLSLWGWLSIFLPSYRFGHLMYIYERLQPFSVALCLTAFEILSLFLIEQFRLRLSNLIRYVFVTFGMPILVSVLIVIGMFLLVAITKIGLVKNTPFWNVPGIPLSDFQLFFIIIFTTLFIYGFSFFPSLWKSFNPVRVVRLIAIALFLTAFLLWGFTPLIKDTLSLQPTAPQFQPYPSQDARVHDMGAISIIKGYGIYFHQYTDKPLYMVFLSILHFVAGYNYKVISWVQIFFLAWAPVILFFLGKKFHSLAFGIILSLVFIFRQNNAIQLSYKISSVNPKLFMTEMPTMVGIIVFVYLLFLWFQTEKYWIALLCGGIIGATSLFRLNPLLLFLAILFICFFKFWKSKYIIKNLCCFILGTLMIITPWLLSGTSPEGYPWMFIKFIDVINVRYNSINNQPETLYFNGIQKTDYLYSTGNSYSHSSPSLLNKGGAYVLSITNMGAQYRVIENLGQLGTFTNRFFDLQGVKDNFLLIINHSIHNIVTSILSLPDSIMYHDLNTLSKRTYWQDDAYWDGKLPIAQLALVIRNLILIAIGLGYSWKQYRLSGLIPIYIFLCYSLSLAFAMNSGGRYIVPIDWIIYFYYLLSIVLILKFIFKAINFENLAINRLSLYSSFSTKKQVSDKIATTISFIAILILASLIPITNNIIPILIRPQSTSAEVEVKKCGFQFHPSDKNETIIGEILYPYHSENGYVQFSILSGSTIYNFMAEKVTSQKDIESGDQVIYQRKFLNDAKSLLSIYKIDSCSIALRWIEYSVDK